MTPAIAQDVSGHVELRVSESCEANTGKIDITLTPLGDTQIPGPPGIAVLQEKDTGMKWVTTLPYVIESPDEYFSSPPTIQLSYLPGPQEMPVLVADFAYCPTIEECLFAAERIEIENVCR